MEIRFIKSADREFSLVKDIRTSVFTLEQGADRDSEFDLYDEQDADSDYVLIFSGGNAAATGRLAFTGKSCKIGRIAVVKGFRGMGLGDKLVRALLNRAFELGYDSVLVDSQMHAIPFYKKFGFEPSGGQIMDRGLVHMPMKLDKKNYR